MISEKAQPSLPPEIPGASCAYRFRLYVAGATPRSSRAVVNLRRVCETYLRGNYDIEIVDLLVNPAMAFNEHIIAAPTVVWLKPLPERRFIGDLSQAGKLTALLESMDPDNLREPAPHQP